MAKPRYNQNVTVTIKNLGTRGEGVGFWHGYTLFIPGALPGECVRGRISQAFRKHGEVRPEQLLSLSQERVEELCPLARTCGGCQIMHLVKDAQLRFKREKVVKELTRFGFSEENVLEAKAVNEWRYRNKMQLKVFETAGKLSFGMMGRFQASPIEINDCLVHNSFGSLLISKIIPVIQESGAWAFSMGREDGLKFVTLRSSERTGQAMLILTAGRELPFYRSLAELIAKKAPELTGIVLTVNAEDDDSVLGEENYLLFGKETMEEVFFGKSFVYSHSSFLQVNTRMAEEIYTRAISYLRGEDIHRVADLYSGAGILSILLGNEFEEVIGVEVIESAVSDAEKNLTRLGVSNVSFILGKTEEVLPQAGSFDAAVLNPPRMGCEEVVLKTLANSGVKKMVYISCEPKTLARDALVLRENGYTLIEACPFDLFPQTAHVETVALFCRQ